MKCECVLHGVLFQKRTWMLVPLLALVLLAAGCPSPSNHAPTANDDAFVVDQDTQDNVLDVLANDDTAPDTGETLSITAAGTPGQGGTVTIDGTVLNYTPATGFEGQESFTYTISDGNGGTATATVTVTVQLWAADSTTFEVTWASDTVLIDEENLDLLVAADTENHTYTFDEAGLAARGLAVEADDVLVLHGLDVRRISTVTTDAGQLVVETASASLNEAITDGTMAWDRGIEFTPDQVKSFSFNGQAYPVPKDGTPIDLSLTIGEFTYHIQATLDGVKSDFTFTVSKEISAGIGAELVARGAIERFRSQNTYVFSGGELENAESGANGLRGEATLELVVAGSGDNYELLNLPVSVFTVPFTVGPIPVVLDIKIRFIINMIVPVDGSARVSTGFAYDSDLGFQYQGTQVTTSGGLAGHDIEEGEHQTGASGHIAAIFGVGFPRVELSLPGGLATGWAQMAFQIGGTYGTTPPCQTADATLLGSVGYQLSAFGLFGVSGVKTLFQEDRALLRTGDCPPDKYVLTEPDLALPPALFVDR